MAKFYAVAHGFERGIYENWDDAKKQVCETNEVVFPEPNKDKYYAVARGYTVGVFDKYEDVKKYIDGYPQPLHKKFDSLDEAVAYFNKFFMGQWKRSEGTSKKKDDKGTVYYAVARGHTTGVFTSWEECKKQTVGFKGAKFKKFDSEEAATMFAEGKTLKQIEESVGSQKRSAASTSESSDETPQKRKKK